jgi:hypothetical protein
VTPKEEIVSGMMTYVRIIAARLTSYTSSSVRNF